MTNSSRLEVSTLSSSSPQPPSSHSTRSCSSTSPSLPSLVSLVLYCLLVLSVLPSPSSALDVYVKPNDEDCYFEDLQKGEKMYVSFSVQSGGYLDIDIRVYGPDLRVVYEAERQRDGNFQFKATATGSHKVCFGNTMSMVSGKTLSFNTYTGRSLLPLDAAKQSALSPLESEVMGVSEKVYSVHDVAVYLKFREVRHTQTLESTKSRVMWFSLLELMALLAVSVFNILYLRQLFERSGKR